MKLCPSSSVAASRQVLAARHYGLLALMAVSLAGCVLAGPDYVPPKTDVGNRFSEETLPGESGTPVDAEWWKGFEDPELDRLVGLASVTNHDVQVALANLREARAERRVAGFDLFPKVTARAEFTDRRVSPAEFFAPSGEPIQQGLYDVGFDAAWELDLFGRVRSNVAVATAEAQAAEAAQHDTLVSVIAEVARNYMELRGLQQRLAIATHRMENQRQYLALASDRMANGRGTALEVAAAREQLNSVQAMLPPVDAAIQRTIHRLGVLCGRAPESLAQELNTGSALPDLKRSLSVGDPAGLLRRRPDIRVAERRLAADAARVKVSTAELFPRVEFLGTLGFAAQTLSGFADAGSHVYSAGPSITWSAFDLGRVRARLKAAGARADASLAAYEGAVLKALEETENALVDYGRERSRRDYLRQAVQAGQDATNLADRRYQGGVADLSVVLDAREKQLQAAEGLADSEAKTSLALVSIYKSLGGGWESIAARAAEQAAEPAPQPAGDEQPESETPQPEPKPDKPVIQPEPFFRDRGL